MAILNITYNGISADLAGEIDAHLSDAEIRRIAVEVVRSGAIEGLWISGIADDAFRTFVVDRFESSMPARVYLRPKVPFGGR